MPRAPPVARASGTDGRIAARASAPGRPVVTRGQAAATTPGPLGRQDRVRDRTVRASAADASREADRTASSRAIGGRSVRAAPGPATCEARTARRSVRATIVAALPGGRAVPVRRPTARGSARTEPRTGRPRSGPGPATATATVDRAGLRVGARRVARRSAPPSVDGRTARAPVPAVPVAARSNAGATHRRGDGPRRSTAAATRPARPRRTQPRAVATRRGIAAPARASAKVSRRATRGTARTTAQRGQPVTVPRAAARLLTTVRGSTIVHGSTTVPSGLRVSVLSHRGENVRRQATVPPTGRASSEAHGPGNVPLTGQGPSGVRGSRSGPAAEIGTVGVPVGPRGRRRTGALARPVRGRTAVPGTGRVVPAVSVRVPQGRGAEQTRRRTGSGTTTAARPGLRSPSAFPHPSSPRTSRSRTSTVPCVRGCARSARRTRRTSACTWS